MVQIKPECLIEGRIRIQKAAGCCWGIYTIAHTGVGSSATQLLSVRAGVLLLLLFSSHFCSRRFWYCRSGLRPCVGLTRNGNDLIDPPPCFRGCSMATWALRLLLALSFCYQYFFVRGLPIAFGVASGRIALPIELVAVVALPA